MRQIARCTLVTLLVAGLCNIPSLASSEKPLGFVAQAERARLDSANASTGASVFAGDTFDTDIGGTLRLRLETSQFYLLASSAATLAQNANGAMLTLTRGTAGFSTAASGQLQLDTPAGIVRGAEGKPAYGQVTIKSPNELVVSAFRGELILDNEGEFHSIPEGKSYRVTIEPDAESSQDDNKDFQQAQNHHRKRRIIFALILTGAVAFSSYQIWQELSESPSKPSY
ncbi:MAG TPA: hypothetical protein VEX69_10555 [Candidatus Limnocylindria bacterium]|nr:hypothetical protein [Candidatus Limnocylindria bacterium]